MIFADWVHGDRFGLRIPAHSHALRAGGAAFLTQSFHTTGALAADNRVVRVNRFEEFLIGGTGRKAILSVEYAKPGPDLCTDLFVKFSRDFEDPIRDKSKHLLDPEIRLALLSRAPGFPIAVARCLFGDYHKESGTGLLITERVPFGSGAIQPALEKCFDYDVPNALEHYRALIATDARLAGAHKSGRLGSRIDEEFPYTPDVLMAGDRIPYDAAELDRKTAQLRDFAARFPNLLPQNVRSREFLAQFAEDAQRYLTLETPFKRMLYSAADFVSLCHWNANIDNAWFWRDDSGALQCGLLDWGRVGQLNVAQAVFGALCAAETELWDNHLDELLTLFVEEFHEAGRTVLSFPELKLHVQLFTAMAGLTWILSAPSVVQKQAPELERVQDRFDPQFSTNALARIQLQLLTVFLNAWETQNFSDVLDQLDCRLQHRARKLRRP